MKNTAAASRYAKALLELALDQNKLDAVLGDMNYFLETCAEAKEMELLLNSPIIRADKKNSIFEIIFEQFEEMSMAFFRLITKNGREALLPEIASSFVLLVKEHKGIYPVTLVSASPVDQDTKAKIMDKVKGFIKGEPELTEEMDESLIGGFIVKMGDTQIDASVRNQLNKLKQSLSN